MYFEILNILPVFFWGGGGGGKKKKINSVFLAPNVRRPGSSPTASVVEFLLHIQRQLIYKSMALFNVFYSGASRVGLFSISQFLSVNFNKDVLLVLDTFVRRKFFTILVFFSSTTFELKGLKLV